MIFGPLLVLVVLFARGGIAGAARRAARRGGAMAEPLLRHRSACASATARLAVTDDVSLDVPPGEIHAVIGPNGAGKTTLIHQISGRRRARCRPDPVRRRATSPRLSVAARVRGAGWRARSRSPRSCPASRRWRMSRWRCRRARARASASSAAAAARRRSTTPAMAALDEVGLAERAAVPAGALSHGEKRALELAIALAHARRSCCCSTNRWPAPGRRRPSALIALLRRLKRAATPSLLVEHDMEAVFALADRISVLVYGRVIATGSAGRDPRQCRGPRRLSRRGGADLMLAVENLAAGYGDSQVLFGIDLAIGAGRGGDAARPQRHGQDDDGARRSWGC